MVSATPARPLPVRGVWGLTMLWACREWALRWSVWACLFFRSVLRSGLHCLMLDARVLQFQRMLLHATRSPEMLGNGKRIFVAHL